jgi:hypothetical protein
MQNLNEAFEVIKFLPFIEKYTDQNPNGGIRTRKTGKGTNSTDKKTGFKDEEVAAIKAGGLKMVEDLKRVFEAL